MKLKKFVTAFLVLILIVISFWAGSAAQMVDKSYPKETLKEKRVLCKDINEGMSFSELKRTMDCDFILSDVVFEKSIIILECNLEELSSDSPTFFLNLTNNKVTGIKKCGDHK